MSFRPREKSGGRIEDRSYGVLTGFFYGILSLSPFCFKIYGVVIFMHICKMAKVHVFSSAFLNQKADHNILCPLNCWREEWRLHTAPQIWYEIWSTIQSCFKQFVSFQRWIWNTYKRKNVLQRRLKYWCQTRLMGRNARIVRHVRRSVRRSQFPERKKNPIKRPG